MKINKEIDKLRKKYPYLGNYGSVGIFDVIQKYKKWTRFKFFGLTDLIFPYKYVWEKSVKEKMHKRIPLFRKTRLCKKKDYLNLTKN